MSDYVKNLKNIEENLSGDYSTSVELNVESIAEISVSKETTISDSYSKIENYGEMTDISVSYMSPKKVTVKRYILKK